MEHERGAFKVNYEMGRARSVKLQFALSFAFRAVARDAGNSNCCKFRQPVTIAYKKNCLLMKHTFYQPKY
jgi:hypothetical protein